MGIKINHPMYLAFSGISYVRAVVKLPNTCLTLFPNLDFGASFEEGSICSGLWTKHCAEPQVLWHLLGTPERVCVCGDFTHWLSWANEGLLTPSLLSVMSFSFTQNKTNRGCRKNQDTFLSTLPSFQGEGHSPPQENKRWPFSQKLILGKFIIL